MLALVRPTSHYLIALLLIFLIPWKTMGMPLDEHRLARVAAVLKHQADQLQQSDRGLLPRQNWLDDVHLDNNFVEMTKREDVMSLLKPPPHVFENPEALRNYLRQVNEYLAIIGRPRLACYIVHLFISVPFFLCFLFFKNRSVLPSFTLLSYRCHRIFYPLRARLPDKSALQRPPRRYQR